MQYDLMLYAVNGESLASDFASGDPLRKRILAKITGDGGYTKKDLKIFDELLGSGLAGAWPDDETTDPFEAVCWLFETVAERVCFAEFPAFKQFELIEDTGLLPYFDAHDSTIPLPAGTNTAALATALANRKMAALLEAESSKPDPSDQYARSLRTLFLDLIESLEPDHLDLFMVIK